MEDLVEETGVLREKTALQRKALRRELTDIERRQARWQEAFENGDLPPTLGLSDSGNFASERQSLKRRSARSCRCDRRLPLHRGQHPPLPGRPEGDLPVGNDADDKNYLKFLVEEITVTDDRWKSA